MDEYEEISTRRKSSLIPSKPIIAKLLTAKAGYRRGGCKRERLPKEYAAYEVIK